MKILLVGEFSGLHNNLKEGLIALGHEVVLASTGDGWKKYPSDINWLPTRFKGRLGYLESLYKQYKLSKNLKNFDVVQFISNCLIFERRFGLDNICYTNLIKNNKKSFFIAAGADPVIWQSWLETKNLKLSNLIKQTSKYDLDAALVEYLLSPKEKVKTLELIKKSNGIIPIMFEYAEPYRGLSNLCPTIPIPINCDKIEYIENTVQTKLIIFHGLNRKGAKGTAYVEEAFEILRNKYPKDLELIIAGNMPYKEYMDFIKKVNVIVDQTNSYSLGINGLVSLAQGKITLGGAEEYGQKELSYESCPVINITPNAQDIVAKIEELLERRHQFVELGQKSRLFVEKYHNHITIAKKYLEVWESN